MNILSLVALFLFAAPVLAQEFPSSEIPGQKIKAAPRKFINAADVITEESEMVAECAADKICVEGRLYNQGTQTAYALRLLVEIGGSKHGHPRTTFYRPVETTVMEPGDRQEFAVVIDRKITYKDAKGKEKEVEVGKFNYKITAIWAATPPKPPKPRVKSFKKSPPSRSK